MPTRLDPLEYLERDDKWYLGGGRAAMFAPAFPRYLDSLGFWDEAYFADVRLERLFTVLLLDEDGRPVRLRLEGRRWTPDALTQTYTSREGLRVREDKVITAHDTLASRITIHNESRRNRTIYVVLWSLQEKAELKPGVRGTSATDAARTGDFLTFAHTVAYGEAPYSDRPAENAGWGERGTPPAEIERPHALHVALGADRPPVSVAIRLAEPADTAPLWQVSVVPEMFRDGRLADGGIPPRRHGGTEEARRDAVTHRPTDPPTSESGLGVLGVSAVQSPLTPNAQRATPESGHLHLCMQYTLEVPTSEMRTIQLGASLNLDKDRALLYVQNDLQRDVAAESRASWQAYFAGVPYFECSDERLQRYYWYRWYGLRLLTVNLAGEEEAERFPNPCVFEGIGGFRSHISYSAQCHMREAGWMADPSLAYGCLEGMLASQENSGFIAGHIYLWREGRGFYHADWGGAALQLFHITGDQAFIQRIYPGLSRYAEYFERERDRQDSHLYDVVDQGETGQEYMSRYLFVDDSADDWRRIQLKGVDATVYVYRLQRALGEMGRVLGNETEGAVWDRKADATRAAILEKMWDPERGFFFDVDPRTWGQSPYKSATGFYPFLCDVAGEEHLTALQDHLLNPAEFWTDWPVPASPIDDPYFSAVAEWKGRRMSCPWNGRVWPMTNSHVAEALARAALRLDESLKPQAAHLIQRFVEMMFYAGDPERPNCFEHYNPFTGTPCMYRGIDDYQHSWVVDLLVKYLAGLQPGGGDALVFDPLPLAADSFAMEGIRYHSHKIDVRWDSGSGYVVCVDGVEKGRAAERTRIEIPLESPESGR